MILDTIRTAIENNDIGPVTLVPRDTIEKALDNQSECLGKLVSLIDWAKERLSPLAYGGLHREPDEQTENVKSETSPAILTRIRQNNDLISNIAGELDFIINQIDL